MRLNMLFGTLIGFTIAFFLFGLWKDDIDWTLWIALMIGGTAGHFIMVNVNERKKINNYKNFSKKARLSHVALANGP